MAILDMNYLIKLIVDSNDYHLHIMLLELHLRTRRCGAGDRPGGAAGARRRLSHGRHRGSGRAARGDDGDGRRGGAGVERLNASTGGHAPPLLNSAFRRAMTKQPERTA